MKDRSDFLFEEYQWLGKEIQLQETLYQRLEIYTFLSTIAIYGALFGLTGIFSKDHMPLFIWWSVPALVAISGVRCWGHYLHVRNMARYIMYIEDEFYKDYHIKGAQNVHKGDIVGPLAFLTINAVSWLTLLLLTLVVAAFQTWPNFMIPGPAGGALQLLFHTDPGIPGTSREFWEFRGHNT